MQKKEKRIKEKQLVGVEIQHDIYALLCANMYIHGDGRSNLIKGSCFDESARRQTAAFKPNTGFLNPPYKTGRDDREELEFVLNNLEQLEKGGCCVAIVPMSCMMFHTRQGLILKENILKNHTLEAVFSMNDELFHSSGGSVVTAVLVLKAKEPHIKGHKSYFAYWKNDGFYNMKTGGRADYDNQWAEIKRAWLLSYQNRESRPGHSVMRKVTSSDEWCSEAYIATDYAVLQPSDFENSVKDFVVFKFKNGLIEEVRKAPAAAKGRMPLEVGRWKYFRLDELFEVKGSKSFTKRQIREYGQGGYPYVVTSSENNGTQGFYNHCTEAGNVLTIDSATVGSCFYQPLNFSASDHVEKLTPMFEMNAHTAMFIQTVINLEKFRYGFGRKFAQMRIKKTSIKLPARKNKAGGEAPDWPFMEAYIKSLPYSGNLAVDNDS